MMRGLGRARRLVNKERTVWCRRFLLMYVANGIVGQRIVQCVTTFAALRNIHAYGSGAAIKHRLPLVHLAADKPVKVIEALKIGPAIERAGDAGFPVGDVVIL